MDSLKLAWELSKLFNVPSEGNNRVKDLSKLSLGIDIVLLFSYLVLLVLWEYERIALAESRILLKPVLGASELLQITD